MKATGEPYGVKPMSILRLTHEQHLIWPITHSSVKVILPLALARHSWSPPCALGIPLSLFCCILLIFSRTNFWCPWHLIFRRVFFSKVTFLLIFSTTGVLHDPQIYISNQTLLQFQAHIQLHAYFHLCALNLLKNWPFFPSCPKYTLPIISFQQIKTPFFQLFRQKFWSHPRLLS